MLLKSFLPCSLQDKANVLGSFISHLVTSTSWRPRRSREGFWNFYFSTFNGLLPLPSEQGVLHFHFALAPADLVAIQFLPLLCAQVCTYFRNVALSSEH